MSWMALVIKADVEAFGRRCGTISGRFDTPSSSRLSIVTPYSNSFSRTMIEREAVLRKHEPPTSRGCYLPW